MGASDQGPIIVYVAQERAGLLLGVFSTMELAREARDKAGLRTPIIGVPLDQALLPR